MARSDHSLAKRQSTLISVRFARVDEVCVVDPDAVVEVAGAPAVAALAALAALAACDARQTPNALDAQTARFLGMACS